MRTKNMVTLALLSAMAIVAMWFIRVPVVPSAPFLRYDPKDIVIVIGGFLYGPLAALLITVVTGFIEMVTVSESGPIGMLMNVLASAAFACVASALYRWKRSLPGAVLGLMAGCISMTTVMLLWNYLITPIYMGVPRAMVKDMLLPVFLPFNLLKSGLNAAVAMLLYKPVSTALRLIHLRSTGAQPDKSNALPSLGVTLVSLFVIASLVLLILVVQGRL